MMANIVAMFHSALHMDDGYVNHIAIVQDVDGYHNHFLYDEDKGKGAAGTGPFKTNKTSANMCWKPVLCSKRLKCYKTWDFFLRNVLLPYLMKIRLKNVTLSHVGTKT